MRQVVHTIYICYVDRKCQYRDLKTIEADRVNNCLQQET